ncbi:MAG: class I SAM-dependent methyltransferase, partial [Verrucomicrobiota bacterium]|nr:class I SAM-dependent methyltransferase [Verrucomicrobiota bacterium]
MITSRKKISGEAVASHYDELDYFYREVWGDHVHHGLWRQGNETRDEAVLQLTELVASSARVGAGSRVCDIGCGYGATARFLAERGADVTGITISPAQFTVAKGRLANKTNPQFVLGDWLANDLSAGSFDAAIAIESSEHMPNLPLFFAQAHRVLRGGGRLVICAWLSAEQPSAFATKWLLEPICREGRMPQLATAAEYRSLGLETGFD